MRVPIFHKGLSKIEIQQTHSGIQRRVHPCIPDVGVSAGAKQVDCSCDRFKPRGIAKLGAMAAELAELDAGFDESETELFHAVADGAV